MACDPVKGLIAFAADLFTQEVGIIGAVLVKSVIALVGALKSDDDHVFVPAVQKFAKPPGLAESGVGIIEEIVAIPEISDGIALICPEDRYEGRGARPRVRTRSYLL